MERVGGWSGVSNPTNQRDNPVNKASVLKIPSQLNCHAGHGRINNGGKQDKKVSVPMGYRCKGETSFARLATAGCSQRKRQDGANLGRRERTSRLRLRT